MKRTILAMAVVLAVGCAGSEHEVVGSELARDCAWQSATTEAPEWYQGTYYFLTCDGQIEYTCYTVPPPGAWFELYPLFCQ